MHTPLIIQFYNMGYKKQCIATFMHLKRKFWRLPVITINKRCIVNEKHKWIKFMYDALYVHSVARAHKENNNSAHTKSPSCVRMTTSNKSNNNKGEKSQLDTQQLCRSRSLRLRPLFMRSQVLLGKQLSWAIRQSVTW